MKTALITGAAGNLGGLLAEYLIDDDINLNLLIHNKDVNPKLKSKENVKIFKADLADPNSLDAALENVDVIVHFAGILFKHNPEKFLPTTNVQYFKNLLDKAVEKGVKRIILCSFPHVEGESFPEKPATGKLNGKPESVHAKTRLQEEIILFEQAEKHSFEPVSLRVGMVYGRGILMIEGAMFFAKYHLLGVWKKPTWIHLISTPDFLQATKAAMIKDNINGIYHLGDEGIQTLQEFLDKAVSVRGHAKPVRMPLWLIKTAAGIFELVSWFFEVQSPLTRDFVKIGTASYYGDTSKMRKELLPELKYKTVDEGLHLMK